MTWPSIRTSYVCWRATVHSAKICVMPASASYGEHGDWALTINDRVATLSRYTPDPTRHFSVPLPVWEELLRGVQDPKSASIATNAPLVERARAAIVRLRAGFWDRLENADLIEELANALEDR
jgi:hypothetical protein